MEADTAVDTVAVIQAASVAMKAVASTVVADGTAMVAVVGTAVEVVTVGVEDSTAAAMAATGNKQVSGGRALGPNTSST
jgi:hypothetical protein